MNPGRSAKNNTGVPGKGPARLRYAVVIEKADGTYSAYVPDLPGCVATARTRPLALKRIAEAIDLHLAGMREDGQRIPRPTARAEYVDAVA